MLKIKALFKNTAKENHLNSVKDVDAPSCEVAGETDTVQTAKITQEQNTNGTSKGFQTESEDEHVIYELRKKNNRQEHYEINSNHCETCEETSEILFLIGGGKGQFVDSSDERVEAYNSKTGKYHQLMELPMACTASAAAAVPDSSALLVAGGYAMWKPQNKVQLYDFATMQWEAVEPLRMRRWGATAITTPQGVIVIGGCDNGTVHASAELYNHHKMPIKWEMLPNMLTPRCNFGATVVGCQLVVVGGGSGFYFNSALNEVEVFDIGKKTWKSLHRLQQRRYGCSAVAWGSKVIVCGGCDQEGKALYQVEILDMSVEHKQWTQLEPLPAPCTLCRSTILDGKLVVFDGEGGEESQSFVYDFETKKWSEWEWFNVSRGFSVVAMKIKQSVLSKSNLEH